LRNYLERCEKKKEEEEEKQEEESESETEDIMLRNNVTYQRAKQLQTKTILQKKRLENTEGSQKFK
jgi:hypothetical protein